MNSVQDILGVAVVDAISGYQLPPIKIGSAIAGKLFNNVVTAALYEEIEEEDG